MCYAHGGEVFHLLDLGNGIEIVAGDLGFPARFFSLGFHEVRRPVEKFDLEAGPNDTQIVLFSVSNR